MDLLQPLCRNGRPHDPHDWETPLGTGLLKCQGWTTAQAGAVRLVELLFLYAREHRPPFPPPPEGTCLQVSPLAYNLMRQVILPSLTDLGSPPGDTYGMPAEIPVKICTDMEPGAWRLATVTVDTISGGVIR